MASTAPLQTIDDDDEFDWEAAVREIDVACDEATKLSSTSAPPFRNSYSHMGSCPKTENDKPTSSRQSTLDRYIGLEGPKPANQDARHEAQDKAVRDDKRVSSVNIDPDAAKTWIYPENVPVREYQVSITRTALFSNTLVSLPTGLGKTLIAAVVMYNYFRWFPEGKIVFAAPSRPLVMQQIEACHNIVGIPQEWTVDMTGQTSPKQRVCLWKAKRIFFVTPQVLEKDIQSGSCLVKQLVCLVIDEAHRASGNYSYCVAVRELMAVPVQLRILALTATPGSKHQTVQQIIDNLQVSSLEHRSESDPDVTQYLHDKKIELIEVAMGRDAVEVNNLLMDVISPFVARLSAIGVLPKRNFQTLSPCDFLNSRDKFRQDPPQDLPHFKYGEVEGIFGVLITLYHIRKLLSGHGIRPAFEMLEEKLKQGSFARFLSRNEALWKAKVIMQQNLSHGALSPKFSKMLEVLTEHFKTHDAQKSRVIIFSNFRGSVRDIMKSLATIGTYVRATEFIGQNSGKKSKGQSQKVQQAVLEKFRAGGYNVIVATSIGEEGLDIIEVDLVICFDANVSPLRMIQRMGRTGRKNDGRVVVLACEGSELKGYMRKQANSKAIKKLMLNGGMNSFRFHSSPRMVPHVFRPEKKLVKLFIEEFVPRGKKVKDNDAAIQTPKYKVKLTDVETDLVAKYFHLSRENNWRPSLIAFPHFQAFPSRVHEVAHSMRTRMLIDTMQYLHGLSFSNHNKSFYGRDVETSEECFRVGSVEHHDSNTKEGDLISEEPKSDILSLMDTSRTEEKHDWPVVQSQNPPIHSFLFGSDFVSIDSVGRVLVLPVPLFPLKQVSPTKSSGSQNTLFLECLKSDSSHLKASHGEYRERELVVNGVSTTPARSQGDDALVTPLWNSNDLQEEKLAGDERVLQKEISNLELSNRQLNTREIPSAVVAYTHSADESSPNSKVADLSPRLTNLLICGVVPESPIDNGMSSKGNGDFMTSDLDMLPNTSISLLQSNIVEAAQESTPSRGDVAALCMQGETQTPVIDLRNSSSERCISAAKYVGETQTPLMNFSNNSCSKDWILNSGEKSVSVGPKQKLKRLRKYCDTKSRHIVDKEEIVSHTSVSGRSCAGLDHASDKYGRGNKKLPNDARVFIEDEAEASSEAFGDEEDDNEQDSYDGSFIDDRINPTVANTHPEATQCDMMAIYRRSLLSQSPIGRKSCFSLDLSPDNIVPMEQTHDSGSAAGATNPSRHTSHTSTNGDSSSSPLNTEKFSSDSAIPSTTNGSWRTNESRKRKLNFARGGSLPIRNLETEIFLNPEPAGKRSPEGVDAFDDDEFYQGIDLDALEEQAAKQLKSKSEFPLQNEQMNSQNLDFLGSPSFDLGI